MKGNRKRTTGPTMTAIAERLGVSQSTVSKALRGATDLNPETAARVRKAAEEMGFDAVHISNKVNCRQSIGVVFMELCSEYYNGIFTAFAGAIEARGYRAVTMLADFNDEQKQEECIKYLARLRVSGILFLTELDFSTDRIRKTLKKYGVPAVIISRMTRVDFCDVISVNHSVGVEMAVDELCRLGHRRIAFIGDHFTQRREKAFRDTLQRLSLAVSESHIVTDCGRYCKGGYEAAKKIFSLPAAERPTACFAAYDHLAYGILRAAREAGIRIPEDFSVIGVDDNQVSDYIAPRLSSVRMPVEEVGRQASDMLLARIDGSTAPFSTIFLTPKLIRRESAAENHSTEVQKP